MPKFLLFLPFLMLIILPCKSQPKKKGEKSLEIKVVDKVSGEALPYAKIKIFDGGKIKQVTTDLHGIYKIVNILPNSKIEIHYIGYKKAVFALSEENSSKVIVRLEPSTITLNEVTVTAKEQKSKSGSSTSVIGRDAMLHLQPSSFKDLLELLPGGKSSDPVLNSPNAIHIREIPARNSKYETTSQGVSFMIDGQQINSDANLQKIENQGNPMFTKRNFLNRGVDMRTISTDDIEKVEIIRGIPSVEYGNLTSGLVKIERRKSVNNIESRFKADMSSKLLHITKGFNFSENKTNIVSSINILSAKADPRNLRENYNRVTTSLRFAKSFNRETGRTDIRSTLDYVGSFDNEKKDPDINSGNVDSYISSHQNIRFASSLKNYSEKSEKINRKDELNFNISYAKDIIDIYRLVQHVRIIPIASDTELGERDGVYLPTTYFGTHKIDGQPLYINANIKSTIDFSISGILNSLKVGATWSYNKNIGRGQIFDITRPVFPLFVTSRPRPFRNIPATNNLAYFVENDMSWSNEYNKVGFTIGVRGSNLFNIDKSFKIANRIFVEPRSVASWEIKIGNISHELSAGIGWHFRTPSISQLYPEMVYNDLIQLNYYHMNPQYRRLFLKSVVFDSTNKELEPAKNLKWEVKSSWDFGRNNFFITYFRENLSNGFRPDVIPVFPTYKKFDTSGINHAAITDKPDITTLPFVTDTLMSRISQTTNGSSTLKEGIEFSLRTRRFERTHIRATLTGGWFRTTYRNSQEIFYTPNIVLGGADFPYAGLYPDDEGRTYEQCVTNLMFDTNIPKLDLGLSFSLQTTWFESSYHLPVSEYPTKYINKRGEIHPYEEYMKTDVMLQWLKRNNNDYFLKKQTVPFQSNLNLKATKMLYNKRLLIALFVNRIIEYNPDYKSGVSTIRRSSHPYFGMEMNIKI